MNYPLGWSLTTRIGLLRERWPGDDEARCIPLVRPGEKVASDQPVIRLEKIVKTPRILPKVPRLSLPASVGQVLPGAIVSREQGSDGLVSAGLRGTVVRVTPRGGVVIDSQVAVIAGAMGVGRQVSGPLVMWQATGMMQGPAYIPPGALLIVPGPLNLAMLRQALNSSIAGVIASSITARDFESFLRVDLIDLLNCANPALLLTHLPRLTILLTEGLGTIAMPVRTIDLLSKYQGTFALLDGATSVRAQRYAELAISLPVEEMQADWQAPLPDMELRPGALVRVCSGSYEGAMGQINYLFAYEQVFPSGVRTRTARVGLEDGSQLVVPLRVLERIG